MIEPEAFADIATATRELAERADGYRRAQDYYDGRHDLPFATERWLSVYGHIFARLRDNMGPLVVDALVARLKIDGFGVEASGAGLDISLTAPGEAGVTRDRDATGRLGQAGRQRAADLWTYNRMDAQQATVHREAAIKGDAYVIVWPDAAGRAGIYANDAELCYVAYDPELPGQRLWAAKRWEEGDGDEQRIRVNLYYPDRIEKYISVRKDEPKDRSGWEPYVPETGEIIADETTGSPVVVLEPWPLPNPYGRVPVFHFRNKGRQGGCGESELHDLIPLQDALNKTVMDLMVTAETLGYPQRYLTGLQPEIDEETGDPKPLDFKPGQDQFWAAWGDQLQMGQFAAAELTGLVALLNDLRTEIGRLSQTPPHLMAMVTGEIPSGEALKVVESPFTAKVEDRQVVLGNAWEDVASFAVLVDTDSQLDVQLSAEWVDAQPVSELERAQRAEILKRLGLPDRYIWRHVLGLSDIECAEVERLRDAQLAAQAARAATMPPIAGTVGVTPPGLAPFAAAAAQAGNGRSEGAQ